MKNSEKRVFQMSYGILGLIVLGIVSMGIAKVGAFAPHPTPTATLTVPTPIVGDPTDALDGSKDYATFKDNADAGFMQLVTIPYYPSMEVLDDYGYLDLGYALDYVTGKFVIKTQPKLGYHTFAISGVGLDARTNLGCYWAWHFDGRKDSEGFGEAFCISEPDMVWLFAHGAYWIGYRTY